METDEGTTGNPTTASSGTNEPLLNTNSCLNKTYTVANNVNQTFQVAVTKSEPIINYHFQKWLKKNQW